MRGQIHLASSMEDAEAAVRAGATPLAGATWIMRAPIRREISPAAGYVALSRIPALRHIDVTESKIRIGACATHADIAARLAPFEECSGLASAAANSANPAIRNVATIGGNLCAAAFAASDLGRRSWLSTRRWPSQWVGRRNMSESLTFLRSDQASREL
jgi:aerobic carbon-monoxide dehydrogenase medium subunit